MTYRLLSAEEWPRLEAVMQKHGARTPSPAGASAAVAEDADGNIQGILFLQLVIHMEPLVLENPNVRFDRLAQVLHESVSQYKGLVYYSFSETEVVNGMAKHMGFDRLPYEVWKKEVV
jgi:hypothetical protein